MEKTEALDFIGLKEPLSEELVQNKYAERFNYYHMLFANAPNKVIEKIQQQNLDKLNRVRKILLDDIGAKKAEVARRFAGDVIAAVKDPERPAEKPVLAWLIVHTENKQTESFSLREGVTFIGRKKKEDGSACIVLHDDPFVSRTHAFVKLKCIGGDVQVALYDGDGSKQSVNGIFLNGRETRIHQQCALQEGDTVQIGTTKLVLKIKKDNRTVTGEVEEVMQTDFIRTVDIK